MSGGETSEPDSRAWLTRLSAASKGLEAHATLSASELPHFYSKLDLESSQYAGLCLTKYQDLNNNVVTASLLLIGTPSVQTHAK